MNTKWLLFLSFLLGFQSLQSQEISKEEFDMMSEFAHEMCASIFTEKNYIYKEGPYEKDDFFDPLPTSEQLNELVKLIKTASSIYIEEGSFGPQLVFSIKLGEGQADLLDYLEKLSLEESDLRDESGQTINVEGYYNVSRTSEEYKLMGSIDKASYQKSATISGNATYSYEILEGYDQVKLSKKDIGKTFELNNCSFKLVDIIHNQILLEPVCQERTMVNLINFSKENTVYEPYDYMTLMEMQEKDSTINVQGSFTQSSQTIDKKMFNIFKKNPKLSLKKFRKMLTKEEIARLEQQASIYLILEHVAPIGENFVLFSPKFRKEEIKVQY